MEYISLDIETLGLDEKTCSIVEFAAVFDDGISPIRELKTYRRAVINDHYQGQPYAMWMHGKSDLLKELSEVKNHPDYLPHNGISPTLLDSREKVSAVHIDYLCGDFRMWLESLGFLPNSSRPIVAGKNVATFDFKFLNANGFPTNKVFKYRTLDPGSMYALPTDDAPPSLDECLKRAGIDKAVSHKALDDCFDVVKCIRVKWGLSIE